MVLKIEEDLTPLTVDSEGAVRVGGTRVTLDTVIAAFAEGATAEEISHQYPALHLADIYAVLAYYLRRRPDVDAYLRERAQQAEAVRGQNQAKFDPVGVRDRLVRRATVGRPTKYAQAAG